MLVGPLGCILRILLSIGHLRLHVCIHLRIRTWILPVEIAKGGIRVYIIGHGLIRPVALLMDGLEFGLSECSGIALIIQPEPLHTVDGNIHGVGPKIPSTPEPVQIYCTGILHRPEQIRRRRMLERPATGIFAEREIKKFSSHHGFTQDVQTGGRFCIGIGSDIRHRVTLGHDRLQLIFRQAHVIRDQMRRSTAGGIVEIELLFGQELHEGVQTLVHPPPLTLIAVDDHRKEVMANFVDDHTDGTILDRLAVGAVLFSPSIVHGQHGIFHAIGGFNRLSYRIRIWDGVFAINFQGVGRGLGGIFPVNRIGFLTIETHAHDLSAIDVHRHGIPHETTGTVECKITYVLGFEQPGLLGLAPGFQCCRSLSQVDDLDRFLRRLCRRPALLLFRSQHRLSIAQLAGSGYDVIRRHRDGHFVITEGQGELSPAGELQMLPALEIAVNGHPREPLCDGIQIIAVFRKYLVTATSAYIRLIVEFVVPVNVEHELLTRLQGHRQIDPHHRLVDRVRKRFAEGIRHPGDVQPQTSQGLLHIHFFELTIRHPRRHLSGVIEIVIALGVVKVLIQLQPDITQYVRRIVVVCHRFAGRQMILRLIDLHTDVIVRPLLPVLRARGSTGRSVLVRRSQEIVELLEPVAMIGAGIVVRLSLERNDRNRRAQE